MANNVSKAFSNMNDAKPDDACGDKEARDAKLDECFSLLLRLSNSFEPSCHDLQDDARFTGW